MKYFETETIELKEKITETLTKDIESFLNTDGGIIYIGVKDDGTIIGVNNIDNTLKEIYDIITDKIEPCALDCIRPEVVFESNVIIIKLNISKGTSGIYCIKKYGLSSNGCHIRVGTTCKSLTPEMISTRFQKNFVDSDLMIKSPSYYGNISFRTLKIYLSEKGYPIDDSNFERYFKLVNQDGKYNLLAELLSDKNPIPFIVVKFKGYDKTSISERTDYGSNSILLAYDKIKTRLESENRCMVDTTIRPRIEKYLFDMDSVNEVLLNALIHNDYRITQPLVALYDDRLEITSHGGLPLGLTQEEFFMGISKPRNASLMEIFSKLGIVEHTGHGIPTVIKKYGKEVFDIHDHLIIVTIPFDKDVLRRNQSNFSSNTSVLDIQDNKIYTNLSIQERLVLNQLIINPYATTSHLQEVLKIPFRTVQRIVAKLKMKGLIERVGSNKTGNWKINNLK